MPEFIKQLADAKLVDLIGVISGVWAIVGIPTFVGMVAVFRKKGQLAKKRENSLADAIEASEVLIQELNGTVARERTRADQYDPNVWLAELEKERKDGNEVKGIDGLRRRVLQAGPEMQPAFLELARHHVALYPDQGRLAHLLEARRLARIANQLRPDDRSTGGLLEELEAVIANEGLPRQSIDALWDEAVVLDPLRFGGGLSSEEATALVEQLNARALENIEAGHYRIAERIAHRARAISLVELGEAAPLTCVSRTDWAASLAHIGAFQSALEETQTLLPLGQSVFGSEHIRTLRLRFLLAQILPELGRDEDALRESEDLLQVAERVVGSEDEETLVVRHLLAQI